MPSYPNGTSDISSSSTAPPRSTPSCPTGLYLLARYVSSAGLKVQSLLNDTSDTSDGTSELTAQKLPTLPPPHRDPVP